jgi:phosphoglycolate phosphatase
MELPAPQALLFDLDGTLVDSVADIANAANAVRVSRAAEPMPAERIRRLIGDGARKLMERVVADLDVDPADALSEFRKRYSTCCLDETRPYAGVVDSLAMFDRWPCAVVSNKPQRFTEMVVEGTGLASYFGAIIGAPACWMIGDSPNDLRAARAIGGVAIGVSYGLVERESLVAEEPDRLLESFPQLNELLPMGD